MHCLGFNLKGILLLKNKIHTIIFSIVKLVKHRTLGFMS